VQLHIVVRRGACHRAALCADPLASPRNDGLQIFGATQLAIISPSGDDTAVTNAPQATSTSTTAQVQCLSSDSDVNSNVA